ncbi:hypothetical protein CCAX7_007350 [Capsulimonas corticalis]|uniref:Uncharacterized protein n=2 Tax=Capsulimonas corticalis TaxID=2219043 RepID=A0A402D1Q1_9BACT|nr:hypothetical protein CCAX7_007350 [Capsulimonas corticalis]
MAAVAIFLVLGAACVFAAPPARAAGKYAVAGIDHDASVALFLRTLKIAAANNDAKKIASLAAFPLHTSVHGKPGQTVSPALFLRRYPAIFTPKVKKAVARQREKDLFVNWRGVMIGDGEVWFAPVKGGRLKIIAVNN